MIPFISEQDKKLIDSYDIKCEVEKGIGRITYGARSFKVRLFSSDQTELSSYLEDKQVKKIAQKVAVILLKNEILQCAPAPLYASITKDKITNLNGYESLPTDGEDYHQIEAYLFQILNRDKPKERVDNNALMLIPLYKPAKTTFLPRLNLSTSFPEWTPSRVKFKSPSLVFDEKFLRKMRISLDQLDELEREEGKKEAGKDKALTVTHARQHPVFYVVENDPEELEEPSTVRVEDVTDQKEEMVEASQPSVNQTKELPQQTKLSSKERETELNLVLKSLDQPSAKRKKNRKRVENKTASTAVVPFSKKPVPFFSPYLTSFLRSNSGFTIAGIGTTLATLAIAYTFFRVKMNLTSFAFKATPLPPPPPYF